MHKTRTYYNVRVMAADYSKLNFQYLYSAHDDACHKRSSFSRITIE